MSKDELPEDVSGAPSDGNNEKPAESPEQLRPIPGFEPTTIQRSWSGEEKPEADRSNVRNDLPHKKGS